MSSHPLSGKSKTKSRNGCITCKSKRLKCDEQKPECLNCIKRNIKCGGYAIRFKWRSFNEKETLSEKEEAADGDADVKVENAPKSQLLLRDHLELASLSMVGKSTRDIKIENDLLARGINPESYKEPQNKKRMRRSFSHSDTLVLSNTLLQRSYSTNTPQDVQVFRNNARKTSGLQSLAEAAADEIKARPPMEDTLALSHFQADKLLRNAPTPKEWLFNGSVPTTSEIPTPHTRDVMSDLNLTPSLTALINHVFTYDDAQREPMGASMTKVSGAPDAPLSPLDLSIGSSINLTATPSSMRRNSIISNQDVFESKLSPYATRNKLLMDVGDQLSQCEPVSPSIASSSSIQSLLRSSEYEQIIFLFLTYTCGIMSIKAGMSENPWRNVVLPLATHYTYLFNLIASMTLFHLAGNSKLGDKVDGLRARGYFYMKKCILELASGLSKVDNNIVCENQLPADIALATCINLAVSESWDTHTSSGIAHLKGAKSMIQKILTIIRLHTHSYITNRKTVTEDTKRKLVLVSNEDWRRIEEAATDKNAGSVFIPRNLQLLFNAWIYFEVLSQMTSYLCRDDKGIDLVATITKIIHQTQKKRDEDKGSKTSEKSDSPQSEELGAQFGFLENFDTMLSNNDYIDPLLGCAQSLFLIMGRVANLILKIGRASDKKPTRNTLGNISTASELRKQLLDWKPSASSQMAELNEAQDSTWDTYSCVSTAEAYRYATLLYLHQAVPELPSLSSHQLAEKIFILLASIPTDSNLHIIHIFPLLVSSCEAEPGEEREWCEKRWALLTDRIWIGNIDRALEVVKEVWRRKDDQTRRVRREMTDSNFARLDLEEFPHMPTHIEEPPEVIEDEGIGSKLHWSSVMREWGWEVLLA